MQKIKITMKPQGLIIPIASREDFDKLSSISLVIFEYVSLGKMYLLVNAYNQWFSWTA